MAGRLRRLFGVEGKGGIVSEAWTEAEASGRRGPLGKHAFTILGVVVAFLLGTATIVYHFAEGWTWVDSFYFSAVAVTTVGFGDLTPSTDASKLFTVLYVFSGIAVVTTYLSELMHRHSDRILRRRGRS